jgi:iron-sulfur cluster assembly protein
LEQPYWAVVLGADLNNRDDTPTANKRLAVDDTTAKSKVNAPISLTDTAAEEIRKIMREKEIPEGYALRVGIKGGGCSGMSYILGFDKKRDFDQEYDVADIPVLVDRRHGLYLMGITIDYQQGLNARGFVFNNPNATATCGCGSSFAA